MEFDEIRHAVMVSTVVELAFSVADKRIQTFLTTALNDLFSLKF
jgi:hypothetical protein